MPVAREEIQSRITEVLGHVHRVLDVGSGNCDLVLFLAREVATEAVGIDINGRTVHEQVAVSGDGTVHTARCVHMDARDMAELEENHFDAVVSTHALHEIEEPKSALQEIRRVMKPGGTLFIADFTDGETRWDEDYYTTAQVEKMLKATPFQCVEVQEVPTEPFLYATATK